MTRKDFEELVNLCYSYDPYTMYIDNYQQEKSANACNERLNHRFNDTLQKYVKDYNEGVAFNRYSSMKLDDIKENLLTWLVDSFNITVEEPTKKIWEVSFIRNKVASDNRWALRGLLAIYKFQTEAEKSIQDTVENNGVGFNGADSKILSSIAEFYLNNNVITNKQLDIVKKRIPKYANQLARIANSKEA